jgi:Tfp pilus assembly ATPase PilU
MIAAVAGMYNMVDLLKLVAREGAKELLLEPGRPPVMALQGKWRVVDGETLTSANVAELFKGLASGQQRRELERCGDIQFVCAAEHLKRFNVTAESREGKLVVKVRNLAV